MGFTMREYDLRKTFATEKKLLLFAGFYPRRTSKNSCLYFLGAFVNLLLSFSQLISMGVQMIIDRNDLSKLSETLEYFITHVTYMCKLANFVFYKKMLLEVEHSLTSPVFYGFSDTDLKRFKEKIRSCKSICVVYRISCLVAVSFYNIGPYLDSRKSRGLPTGGWYPFNATNYYYSTYGFESISVINTACLNFTIDILIWMLITIATAQFDILKENLKSIDYSSDDLQKTEESFKNCVKHHEEIIKLVQKIESMFSKGILLQFLASVLVICFNGLMMIIVPFQSVQFGFLVAYFSCMMCQVAMYCWYGHDVMTTSDQIGESFYVSNWYESDLSIRKSVSIFLEKTKKPVSLTAGGFVTLSLTTLTGILRSSYSYFAVLQHVYNKD